MCGFPIMHLDKYLKVLVLQNKRFVAMCEEFPRPPSFSAKDGFDRRVVRVITPGTLVDESFLNPYENNYLLAVSPSDSASRNDDVQATSDHLGLAWIDVSTGEFFTKNSTYESFRDELARISPREIVLDKGLKRDGSHPIRRALLDEGNFISYITPLSETTLPPGSMTNHCSDDLITPHDVSTASAFAPCEASAIKLLTTFLRANLLERMPPLPSPSKEVTEGRMQIDSHTIKALEIRESLSEGGKKGSLLSVIRRTVTNSGTRLLTRWLCKP
jgi:DNA mismatch repair ATPase MutS